MTRLPDIRSFPWHTLLFSRVGPVPIFSIYAAVVVGLAIGLPLTLLREKPQDVKALCRVNVAENNWRYIIIHHSATSEGSARSFDSYHKNERGWRNGLGYHFVIGNGTQSGDGEIEVGERWRRQLHGAHTGDTYFNRLGIGICLVGNFEQDDAPTGRQFESLVRIVRHLSKRYNILPSNIILHKEVRENHTACPGKNFPYDELRHRLMDLASKDVESAST